MEQIKIQMFGEFSISYGDKVINEKNRRSKKMWSLLKYLICFRDREITQKEIIDLLWENGESENPVGALKTQLHRLRAVIGELSLPDDTELIVSSMGSYAFNKTLDYTIDTVEFERFYKNSQRKELSEKEHTAFLIKAFNCYKGDFMRKADTDWSTPIRLYYHSMYIRVVHQLADIYYRHKQYGELINISEKAVLIENSDEKLHAYLIKALCESGQRVAARKHYNYVSDLFLNKLGINLPDEITALYEEIVKEERGFEQNLELVKKRLDESEHSSGYGAFFCEIEFFKHIYQLELREAKRNRNALYICLITIKDKNENVPAADVLGSAVNILHSCISSCLRSSDVFARYSAAQFVILLLSNEAEVCKKAMDRILTQFRKNNAQNDLTIEYDFGAVN